MRQALGGRGRASPAWQAGPTFIISPVLLVSSIPCWRVSTNAGIAAKRRHFLLRKSPGIADDISLTDSPWEGGRGSNMS